MKSYATEKPVLFIGGTGMIGKGAVEMFRAEYPDYPITIASRHYDVSCKVAKEVGNANAVAVDTSKEGLDLPEGDFYSAVVINFKDRGMKTQRYAMNHKIPHITMSGSWVEWPANTSEFINSKQDSIVALGFNWMGGVMSVYASEYAKELDKVHIIRLANILDEADPLGPEAMPSGELFLEYHGAMVNVCWQDNDIRFGNDVRPEDEYWATDLLGNRLRTNNNEIEIGIASLKARTDADTIYFNMIISDSYGTKTGGKPSHDMIIELEGTKDGKQKKIRHTICSTNGQAVLVSVSTFCALERMLGLYGEAPKPGIYYTECFLDKGRYEEKLLEVGCVFDVDAK